MTTIEKTKVDPFPPEVRSHTTTTLNEWMPPVQDEETGEITYFCAVCGEVKTASDGESIGFFTSPDSFLSGWGASGNVCPECEAEGGY
jgi:hypothetical protein